MKGKLKVIQISDERTDRKRSYDGLVKKVAGLYTFKAKVTLLHLI
jgi:hypothetical protein